MRLSQLKFNDNLSNQIVNIDSTELTKELFSVQVSKCNHSESFLAFIDDNNVDYKVKKMPNVNQYILEIKLPSNYKTITLVYVDNNQYCKVFELKAGIAHSTKSKLNKFNSKISRSFIVLLRGIRYLWREHHFLIPFRLWKDYFLRFKNRFTSKGEVLLNPFIQSDYLSWIEKNEKDDSIIKQNYEPLISILIPVYNIGKTPLSECLDSLLNQSYANFEVCIVDDCSTNDETIETLKEYERFDSRIRVKHRETNGHISKSTNDALEMAKGEFVGLLDNDDTLAKDALYENVLALNKNKDLDLIYSDEDKLDLKGKRCEPHFKPDFSPDTLLGVNYICHFSVLRTRLVRELGGFTVGLEGVQDHDLFLRVCEVTKNIYHIPKILYHWRMVEGSTSMSIDNKGYAIEKGIQAINNALARRKTPGTVKNLIDSTVYQVEYTYESEPSVTIVIPTRDFAEVTDKCLKSIFQFTDYKNYEVFMVDNNSIQEETFEMFDKYKKEHENFKVIKADMEFNYSAINNLAVKNSNSDVIVLLNNDTEVISKDWLKVMVGYAIQSHIGAVGAKLLYPDNTIQHGGIVLGKNNETAGHIYTNKDRKDVGHIGRLLFPYNYSAVTGACLAVERKKYNEVDGLDEKLRVAFNDIDFCLKLLEKGYYNLLAPQVELYHHESKSRGLDRTEQKHNLYIDETNYMSDKWGNYLANDPYSNPNFSNKDFYMFDRNK